jgi:signal transduction histidine kinase
MSTAAELAPQPEESWRRETLRFVGLIFRARFALIPVMALVFTAFLVFDRIAWKLAWIGATATLMLFVAVTEQRRLRVGALGPHAIAYNLGAMLCLQAAMIYVTGGIESPLLVLFVPLGTIAGLSLGTVRRALALMALPVGFTCVFAVGALGDFVPRATPAFLGLGAGFSHCPVYVWSKAGFIILLVTVTAIIGTVMRRAYEKVIHDVAEARRETVATLASRNREIVSVAGTVAHELKNPLTSIQGLAQLLARGAPAGTKDRERLDVMLREIGRMGTVLEEFRTFSRPLASLLLQPADLGQLIADVALLSEGAAGGRGVRFAPPAGPLTVSCDRHKVKQALLNLVQNALDASPPGGTVTITAAPVPGDRVEIQIGDAGPGLDPAVALRLFTPGVTTKAHGSGLGLVVARAIAEQHGGTLTLGAGPGGGCVATVTVPRTPPPAPLEVDA